MAKKFQGLNLTNRKFGKLTILKRVKRKYEDSNDRNKDRSPRWLAICDCGNRTYVTTRSVLFNKIKITQCAKCGGKQAAKTRGCLFPYNSDELQSLINEFKNIYLLCKARSLALSTVSLKIKQFNLTKPPGFYSEKYK